MRRVIVCFLLIAAAAYANVQVKSGTFAQGATTVTVGFQPQALLLFASYPYVNGTGSVSPVASLMIGFVTSANQMCSNNTAMNGVTASQTFREGLLNRGVSLYDNGGIKLAEATVTLTATGFTLSWGTDDAVGRIFSYWAIGGSEISATSGSLTNPIVGNSVTTTTGFQPSAIFFMGTTSSPGDSPFTAQANADQMFGFAIGTATQGSFGWAAPNASNPSVLKSSQLSQAVDFYFSSAMAGHFSSGSVTSISSSGFTYTTGGDTTGAAANSIQWLAIGGGSWTGGAINQPSTGGAQNQNIVATGMAPLGALLFSMNSVSSTADNTSYARVALGISDGTNKSGFWMGVSGAASPQVASSYMDTASLLNIMVENGGTATTQATADSISFTPNLATLHWSLVDTTPREFMYVIVGSGATHSGRSRRLIN